MLARATIRTGMADTPFRGAFPHQHQDPRDLRARIAAQLRERIEEALEMFALKVLVDRRAREGRPAPETSSDADRREFEQTDSDLIAHLRRAFDADLAPELRQALAEAEQPAAPGRERLMAGQVWLAGRLPDYWQQLERHAAAFPGVDPSAGPTGWLARIFGASARAKGSGPGQGG
jgi:hypothetical protein